MMNIVKEISHIRKKAKLMIQKAQDHITQQIVGKKVLCHDSAKESWYSEKLESKWKEPYQIAAILLNGLYKITDQGKVLWTPVNGDRLKSYNYWSLKLIVVIENI